MLFSYSPPLHALLHHSEVAVPDDFADLVLLVDEGGGDGAVAVHCKETGGLIKAFKAAEAIFKRPPEASPATHSSRTEPLSRLLNSGSRARTFGDDVVRLLRVSVHVQGGGAARRLRGGAIETCNSCQTALSRWRQHDDSKMNCSNLEAVLTPPGGGGTGPGGLPGRLGS